MVLHGTMPETGVGLDLRLLRSGYMGKRHIIQTRGTWGTNVEYFWKLQKTKSGSRVLGCTRLLIVAMIALVSFACFVSFFPREILSQDQEQPIFNAGWGLYSGMTIGQQILPRYNSIYKLETSVYLVGDPAKLQGLTVRLFEWRTNYSTTISGKILVEETHDVSDWSRFNTWELKFEEVSPSSTYLVLFLAQGGDKDNMYMFQCTTDSKYPGEAYLNGLLCNGSAIYFRTYHRLQSSSSLLTLVSSLLLTSTILGFYLATNIEEVRRKDSTYSALIVVVAMVVFSNLLIAPLGESVNGYDINGLGVTVGRTMDYHLWVLKTSLMLKGVPPTHVVNSMLGNDTSLGHPEIPIFYFSTPILLLMPNTQTTIRLLLVIHAAISGISMYILLRVWKLPSEPSFVGSMGYMLSGFFYARILGGHVSMIFGYSWAPLVIALYEFSLIRNSLRIAFVSGISLALQILSGGVVTFFYTLQFFGLYFLYSIFRVFFKRKMSYCKNARSSGRRLLRILGIGFSMVSSGYLISAIKINPEVLASYVLGISLNRYANVVSDIQGRYVLEPFFHSPTPLLESLILRRTTSHEYIYYMGFLCLFACLSILYSKERKLSLFLFFSTMLAIMLALGNSMLWTYIEAWLCILFGHFFKGAARFLMLSQLTIPALATLGLCGVNELLSKVKRLSDFPLRNIICVSALLIVLLDLTSYGLPYISIGKMPEGYLSVYKFSSLKFDYEDAFYRGAALTLVWIVFLGMVSITLLRKKSQIVSNLKPSRPRQSKHLRIAYVVNGLGFAAGVSLGGSDRRVLEIATRLSKQKASILILTTTTGCRVLKEGGLDSKYYVLAPPFSWYPMVDRTSVGRTVSYLFEILKGLSLRMPEHDIIYSSSDFICDTIPAWNHKRKNPRIKWVAMIHHMIQPPWKRKGNILVNIINYVSQQISFILMKNRVDLIFVYGTPEGRIIKNYLSKIGISQKKIMTVMNGVDYKFITHIPDQQTVYDACFVGGLRPSKGIFDLPQIWKRLCEERSLAKLVIIGGGSAENTVALRRDVMKNKLSNNIIMAGPLSGEKLFKIMKSCRILISPSYEEGWGIAVCEGMSCRLPVVAYDLPAYEVFDDAIIKVPVGNTEVFARAALELLSNEKLWNEASAKATRTAERFDWDITADEEWAILDELAN